MKELYIFGSILTEGFNDLSDVDFLVQFDDIEFYFENEPRTFDDYQRNSFQEELSKGTWKLSEKP